MVDAGQLRDVRASPKELGLTGDAHNLKISKSLTNHERSVVDDDYLVGIAREHSCAFVCQVVAQIEQFGQVNRPS